MTEDGVVTGEVLRQTEIQAAKLQAEIAAKEAEEIANTVIKFSAKGLYKKYEDNQIAADVELKNVKIEVSGTIHEAAESMWGEVYVVLKADSYGLETVNCYFKDKTAVASLNKGKKVKIRGICNGIHLWPWILKIVRS